MSARYFDEDFDWSEHGNSIAILSLLSTLPRITSLTTIVSPDSESISDVSASQSQLENKSSHAIQDANWNNFYDHHEEGMIYKPRRYLLAEFESYWKNDQLRTVLEVGCGYGCSCFPILRAVDSIQQYIATDCSEKALDIFSSKLNSTESTSQHRVNTFLWDITEVPPPPLIELSRGIKIILSVFALSAVAPQHHRACFEHFIQLLDCSPDQDAYILFRDYGLYDMTMFRHRVRLDDYLFARQDGTLCYYFSLEYLREIVENAGLQIVELKYATIINRNRKTGEEMRRVFLHGVFSKSVR